MRMQESFKGDTETKQKTYEEAWFFCHSSVLLFQVILDRFYQSFYLMETMQFMVFKRLTPSLPVLINYMKGK